MLHFYILQLLAKKAAPMSLDEVVEELDTLTRDLPGLKDGFDRNTVRRKLEKLLLEEVLDTEKDKTKKLYKIAEDFYKDFDDEELIDILYTMEFFSNTAAVTLPGYYAMDTLRNYAKQERNLSISTEDIFMYKHNHLQRIIDDEILWDIFEVMKSGSLASFNYIRKNNSKEDSNKIVKPLKIIIDFQYGRQYLLCIDCKKDRLSFYRIDRIKNLKRCDDEILQQKANKVSEECYNKCWCASLGRNEEGSITTKVEAEFSFDEVKKSYILDRIKREGRWGELQKISQNKYLYTIEVTDPEELLPWFRSFGEHVRVKASDEHKLDEKLRDNWKELLIKYGAV
ncbi:WYL domain-containing protein [Clostridium omnivorum]|uniref:WYL domain-containing protein n=2 Tax=Clostridium omnivorum TaxID=1604902 RepID=A0ABQ5N993_9CLOT|nr:WYL domain-containing protein [Clostridium sp. E14]